MKIFFCFPPATPSGRLVAAMDPHPANRTALFLFVAGITRLKSLSAARDLNRETRTTPA